ncbi:thiamine pyrophosphate-binding protein [Chelativorans sp. M5D2P16]|uniref:thiamine pyrophosphate-binding protein n=1 Tax=Chelativorans sp. M5D2P16 TaxID=3095678 RepID=UPI002ACAEB01|nr:thiamine pyrophosphate-binding protein [Chelativorans sp. M5D2P16]MDZ5695690.1 thiamine pyrophosphate-binding protein [Chelativorans sp. M5D2P16]
MTKQQNLDGGAAVVRWLKAADVDHVFSVSGGPINPVYRACAELDLPLVHARHEAAACFMAEAASRVNGKAGAVVVTLGPGATNTVTPALVSTLAGTPLIIIAAQAPTHTFERGAGMSYDPLPILSSVTKWSARVLDVDRISEYLDIAWRKMWAGRPGPVFLEIPADIMAAPLSDSPTSLARSAPPAPVRPAPSAGDAGRLAEELSQARRPLLLLGEEIFWTGGAGWRAVVEKHHLPFATLRLARGIVDEHHPLFMGPGYSPCNATLRKALQEADRVFLIGHHFEFDLEFGDKLGAETRVIQIASDPELLNRNRRADLAIASAPANVVQLFEAAPEAPVERQWVDGLLAGWREEWQGQLGVDAEDGGLHPIAAIDAVTDAAPAETIYVSSHGNVDFWADARLRLNAPGRYLRAGQSGALGAEVPYGAGAAFAAPGAPVIVFVGDGGVGFHVTELDTAERYGKPFIIVVLDDELWGAIALPQEASYGAMYEMDLPRRDWAKVAEGLGGKGYTCRNREEIDHAVKDALASGKPAIIQVSVRSVISPYMEYIS